tara:strand:- start:123 stop:707 length:585 start_codon:yes stop_codon:yes gene_type:complete
MTDIVSPYFNFELYTTLMLSPNQMNNNLYINLKKNLKAKVENKCNKIGYILNIYNILSYDEGILEAENFTGSAKYNIKYSARLCCPIENTFIICKIENMNKLLIKAKNGPILIIVNNNNINTDNFKKDNEQNIIHKNNILKVDDYIIIKVLAKKLNNNDTRICTLGYLENIPTQTQINKFFNIDNEEIDETTTI